LPASGSVGRALRARAHATGLPAKESIQFDTRHNSFGVLSVNRWRIFERVFCVQHREMNHVKPDHAPMPAITEAVSS
jgi:hypothetical protein